MPDPRKLKVGDKVRFLALPEEWKAPGFTVRKESVVFMRALIARKRPSRISRIAEDGFPWIDARMKVGPATVRHSWGIYEETGWRLVRKRE